MKSESNECSAPSEGLSTDKELTMKDFLRKGLLVYAWFVGIMGGLFALVNALEKPPKNDIADTIVFIVVGGGGASLIYLLYRYITNRWDALGGGGRFFVTLSCLAIFAGPLWFLYYVVIALLLVAALIYAFAGPHGAARDWARDADPTNAELMAMRHKLEDINKKL
jgi:hypothetical protein